MKAFKGIAWEYRGRNLNLVLPEGNEALLSGFKGVSGRVMISTSPRSKAARRAFSYFVGQTSPEEVRKQVLDGLKVDYYRDEQSAVTLYVANENLFAAQVLQREIQRRLESAA